MPYQGEFAYRPIKNVLQPYLDEIQAKKEVKHVKKSLIHVEKFATLEDECLSKRRACFISFLDGRINNEVSYNNQIGVLENLVKKNSDKPYSFLHVNATCHDEILSEFNVNIDSLPNGILYVPHKDMYANLIGTFDEENVQMFVDKSIQGKNPMQSFTKDRFKIFSDKDCSLIKEEVIEENTEDDDIMKEMMEEIRKKEEEERILREAHEVNNPDKKKKKKKKKNKKSDL
jgi:hypothetical protein